MLRNSYENLFIMRSAYGIVYNSLRGRNGGSLNQTDGYQIKANVETAGNLLYGVAKVLDIHKNANDAYAIFNIPFSQYVKFDFDYSKSFRFTEASSLALHAAFGVAIPYGNSEIIPYEKRYFAGGANSVRGWNVRTLGPGGYVGRDGNIDFINQTGNLKLDFFCGISCCAFLEILREQPLLTQEMCGVRVIMWTLPMGNFISIPSTNR